MAICDYCGATYRGGAIKDGPYQYCTGVCRERGSGLLTLLDNQMPHSQVDSIIARAHSGPCESCGESRRVYVYWSYRIWSALIYSSWRTNSYVVCRACARNRQLEDLATCLVAGWWSPPGFLITPFFIMFNIVAMFHRYDAAIPSERFRKLIRMNLARSIANPR
jgi:hypothetical protein